MDFLVSDLDSYRRLRQLLTGEAGFAGLLRPAGERFQLAPLCQWGQGYFVSGPFKFGRFFRLTVEASANRSRSDFTA